MPAWSAAIVQVPVLISVRAPLVVIVQTAVVDDVNVGVNPDDDVAVSVGDVPRLCWPGLANAIVWVPFGVTAFDAADSAPVPAEFVAVNVNV